jgi:hypothetical protein
MMADICNCAGSRSCGCRVPSQRMSNAQGSSFRRTERPDRLRLAPGREADFEPWPGPTDPNPRVNREFEEVSVGVTNVDARTCFPAATLQSCGHTLTKAALSHRAETMRIQEPWTFGRFPFDRMNGDETSFAFAQIVGHHMIN